MGLRSSIKHVLLSSFRWPMNGQTQHTWHGRLVGDSPFHLFYINFLRLFSSHFTLKYSWSSLASRLPQQPRNYCQTHTVGRRGGYGLRRTGRKKWPIRIMLSKQIAHSSRGTSSASQASKPAIQASNQQWYSETAARLHILNCAFH